MVSSYIKCVNSLFKNTYLLNLFDSGLTINPNGTINAERIMPSEKLNIPMIINAVPISSKAAICNICKTKRIPS